MTLLRFALLWIACLLGSLARAEFSATSAPAPGCLFAPLRQAPAIDGDLADWTWDDRTLAITRDNATLEPPPVASDDDSSARLQLAWNGSDTLWFAAIVRDQATVLLPKPSGAPWEGDGLCVSLSVFGGTRDNPRFCQQKTVDTAAEPFFGYSFHTDPAGIRQWTANSRYVVKPIPGGYAIEAAISLADIGYGARPGDRVKIAFILSDHDPDGKFSQLIAGHRRFASEAAWFDLRFLGVEPYAGQIVPVQRLVAAGEPVAFSGQIDSFADGLSIAAIRLKNQAGEVLATLPAAAPLPAGQRTLFAGAVPAPALPPGSYQLAVVTARAGQEANGAVHDTFTIIASEDADAALAGKLPDRYLVPDPVRFAFPSDRRRWKPRQITKADYIAHTRKVVDFEASLYDKGRDASAGQHGIYYAIPSYMLYKESGNQHYLDATLGLMASCHAAHEKDTVTPHWIMMNTVAGLLLQDPAVPEAEKVWLREFMPRVIHRVWADSKPTEWGAFNRALIWGGFCDNAAKALPNHPDVAKWRQYADLEWSSWWPYRDHDENSSDYNAASMMDYFDWAEFRDPKLLEDPGWHVWLERYMHQVTPSGGMPGYGDAGPWNESSWLWIAIFERMATLTRDGRYKWAAHRLFDYATSQLEDLFSYHMVYDNSARGCALAWFYADDSIPETAPDYRSRVTTRKRVDKIGPDLAKEFFDKYGITGLFYQLADEPMPDKLILRAGGDPFSPAAMIELCSDAGHQMSSVPNLNSFMDMRSVLLLDLGYYEKGPEYHNVIFIEDLTGIAPSAAEEVVSVPAFQPGIQATYAAIHVDNYKRWPVLNDRRVLFTVDGPMLVKDRVLFHQPFVTRVRQQWQTRDITPKAGPNWVNVSIPWMLNSGLGLGRGVSRWLNPNWDLLVYYTPQPGRDYEVFDRSLENIWQSVPLRISQRYRGLPELDRPIHFTTLLWPHKPVFEVESYANRVAVLQDDPAVTAIQVKLDNGFTLVLGINDPGQRTAFGPVDTDARAFVVRLREDGSPAYVLLHDATFAEVSRKAVLQGAERADFEKSF